MRGAQMKCRYVYPLLIFSFLCAFTSASAQISIQRSDIESLIGTTIDFQSFDSGQGQEAAIQTLVDKTGANQTWNFTTVVFSAGETITSNFVALPAGLPGSNDARVANANYAVQTFIPGNQGTDEGVGYFRISDSQLLSYGLFGLVQGQSFDLLYDQGQLVQPVPLDFNDTWNGLATYQQEAGGFTSDVKLETSGVVNGWGMLILPGQNPVSVLRLEVETTMTTTTLGIPFVSQFTTISFVSKSFTDAAITITPPIGGFGADVLSASYSEGTGGGGTQAPTDAPGGLVPANNAMSVDVNPNLSWGAVTGADTYDVQVATDASFTKNGGFSLIVDVTGLIGTSYDVTGLDFNTTYHWRSRGVNTGGVGPWSPSQSFTTVSNVAVEQLEGSVPTVFALYGNYPNPFNPQTTIRFDIAEAAHVRLSIFDVLGRELDVLVADQMSPGRYEYTWEATTRPSGVYLYRLQANTFSKTGTMLLVK